VTIWAVIPLASSIAHAALLAFVVLYPRKRVHNIFAVYLGVAAFWSFTSFMLHMSTTPQQALLWNEILLIPMMGTLVAYYHFARSYVNKPAGAGLYAGYAILLAFTGLSLTGYIVKSAYVVNGVLYHDLGASLYLIGAGSLFFIVAVISLLVKKYRSSLDPTDRNRTMYLIAGWVILVVLSYTNLISALAGLSLDHIGNLANALIITFAILKYQLLDIRLVARRGLAYFILGAGLIGVYAGIIALVLRFLPGQPFYSVVLSAASAAILLAVLARPLRYLIQEKVERLFHRETYAYRQALLSFSSKMGNSLDLSEVANEMLTTICKALRLTHAKLLFQETSSGDFITQFTYPKAKDEAANEFRLSTDNPIVSWLVKDGKPLNLKQLASIPQLKGLWTAEKEELAASGLGLLCPIKSRDRLVGILALGKKQSDTLYSHEDIELVTSMASQASIVIENAQLYTQATIRANTDGLTGLYNHRHFHERLEQEIARGSRFGTMFSLIMMDIDLFKTYNDIYGHLAGDRILRKMAEHLKGSIRSIDMAFRYGGEEFTIILPETRLDDAYNVAERIRKTIETRMSSKATSITISLGVASWPADGVTREEIIAFADAALYRAKQTGRNRTCLSTDIAKPGVSLANVNVAAQRGALSIIYALAATVDAKDHYTYGHSKKVSEYAVATAEALKLPQDRIATIQAAALLHDIGKIGVPDSILNKQGALTEAEWEPIKEHPHLGVDILRHVIDLINCLPAILHHHERYDGTGYPTGLQGNNIPLEARILAIADAYDAMTSLRPYRKRLLPQQAVAELKHCAGTRFDPELVDIFCQLMEPALLKELEKNKVSGSN
jgi:diguanylate cyclase (GGDEF)-like protein